MFIFLYIHIIICLFFGSIIKGGLIGVTCLCILLNRCGINCPFVARRALTLCKDALIPFWLPTNDIPVLLYGKSFFFASVGNQTCFSNDDVHHIYVPFPHWIHTIFSQIVFLKFIHPMTPFLLRPPPPPSSLQCHSFWFLLFLSLPFLLFPIPIVCLHVHVSLTFTSKHTMTCVPQDMLYIMHQSFVWSWSLLHKIKSIISNLSLVQWEKSMTL